MMYKSSIMVAVLAIAGLPSVAHAGAQTDPLRCQALRLRCESKLYGCVARCDSLADVRVARLGEEAETGRVACEQACQDRHDAKMDRMEAGPPCAAGDPAANPQQCEAKMLGAEASYLLCRSRCEARADKRDTFDLDGCTQACKARYGTATDRIIADPVCDNGRVATPNQAVQGD